MKNQIYNIVLIHVARTWERIRVIQKYEEMPLDNIESTVAIQEIADSIMLSDVIQEFIETKDSSVWNKYGDEFSDSYIERMATDIIKLNYL